MCEELLDEDVCDGLGKTIKILKLKGVEAEEFIEEATRKGLKSGRSLRNFIEDRIDKELNRKPCKDILGKRRCKKIKDYADKLGASAKKVRESIKNVISDGVSSADKVFDKTLGKLKRKLNKNRAVKKAVSY